MAGEDGATTRQLLSPNEDFIARNGLHLTEFLVKRSSLEAPNSPAVYQVIMGLPKLIVVPHC